MATTVPPNRIPSTNDTLLPQDGDDDLVSGEKRAKRGQRDQVEVNSDIKYLQYTIQGPTSIPAG
jgi:hypothetical protein